LGDGAPFLKSVSRMVPVRGSSYGNHPDLPKSGKRLLSGRSRDQTGRSPISLVAHGRMDLLTAPETDVSRGLSRRLWRATIRMFCCGLPVARKVGIMATGPPPSTPSDEGATETSSLGHDAPPAPRAPRLTRASAVWVATGAGLLLLVLLIVFMLQNSTKVGVHFLGLTGTIPLGMALLIAAVGGGVVVAIAGVARVTQLRMNARRTRRGTTRG